MPSMHKTREQVAELFERKFGVKLDSDPAILAAFARQKLRQVFIDAEMGVSGANIAIADTGTLVLVTNEGNARLVTTLPPIHVAVVGYEKLVESLSDATAILEVLPRSATGQKITSYVSFTTGPSRTADIEKTLTLGMHGPKEVHIVFVDNGRKAMRCDEKLREALYCIRCGACLNLCPVYRSIGGHAFANVYMGGIGAISTVHHANLDAAEDTVALCNGCGKCVSTCPAKIDVPGMILDVRRRMVEKNGIPLAGKLALSALEKPRVFGALMKMARAFQSPVIGKDGLVKELPLISEQFGERKFPGLARRSLKETLAPSREKNLTPTLSTAVEREQARVALFGGCVIDYVYPHIGEAMWKVFEASGAAMIYPKEQVCCGAPALYIGDQDSARNLCRMNLDALREGDPTHIVTGCPTCAVVLRKQYPEVLAGTELEARAKALAEKVYDFSGLVEALGIELGSGAGGTATYHDPCHQVRGTGTSAASRNLLRQCGLDLAEMSDCDECCGFAGSYSLKQSEISDAILSRKLDHIDATGADCVITDCPGCIMQIGGGLAKRGHKTPVRHSAEVAAETLDGS
jgi:iron-sulfur cluster protein